MLGMTLGRLAALIKDTMGRVNSPMRSQGLGILSPRPNLEIDEIHYIR